MTHRHGTGGSDWLPQFSAFRGSDKGRMGSAAPGGSLTLLCMRPASAGDLNLKNRKEQIAANLQPLDRGNSCKRGSWQIGRTVRSKSPVS